jgi:hypothetical protein
MIFLRLLNVQGIAGLAATLCLAVLLVIQKGETRHWKKQSGQYEQLYRGEQAAFAGTVANYRAAADAARAADQANAARVAAQQDTINERSKDALDSRLADARARAEQLRLQDAAAGTDQGGGGTTAMPRLLASAGRPAQTAGQDRLSSEDALTATEQAIQLDELIKWIHQQAAVDPNAAPASR